MVGAQSEYVEHTGPLTAAGTTYMGGNRCKRCGGSVYHAEEVLGAGLVSISFFPVNPPSFYFKSFFK